MAERRILVIDADREGSALERTVRKIFRDEPGSTEVVVVSHRSLSLSPATVRRVRLVRERTPAEVTARIAGLAAGGAIMVGKHWSEPTVSLSACLIVKDEELVLSACLAALGPFVDEVVVYDTGSTDRTVAIARATGARVVEGYWDDHFGDARNRALEHCTNDWVLFIDADEVITGDPDGLRASLAGAGPDVDVAVVTIVSTSWSGAEDGTESRLQRIARRGRALWAGRLHEQLVTVVSGQNPVVAPAIPPIRLMHSGYHQEVLVEKDKALRNLRLAQMQLAATGPDRPGHAAALCHVGRTLFIAGHPEEAITTLEGIKAVVDWPELVVPAARLCIAELISVSRLDEARAWLDVLVANRESHGNLQVQRARLALAEGDGEEAGRHLDLASSPSDAQDVDVWGVPFDPGSIIGLRAEIALAREDPEAAAALIGEQVRTRPEHVDLALLTRTVDEGSAPWGEILRHAPEKFLDRLVRSVVTMPAADGLRWCEAFCAARPGDYRPVVAGCSIAARGDLMTALTWSLHAREIGQPHLCPVRAGAEDVRRPVYERALWWALLADSFGEFDARARFTDTMAEVSPVDIPALRSSLDQLAPALADAAVEGR